MFIDIGDYLINVLEIACIKPYDHKQDLTWILFKSGEGAAVEIDINTLKALITKALNPTDYIKSDNINLCEVADFKLGTSYITPYSEVKLDDKDG